MAATPTAAQQTAAMYAEYEAELTPQMQTTLQNVVNAVHGNSALQAAANSPTLATAQQTIINDLNSGNFTGAWSCPIKPDRPRAGNCA